MPASYIEEMSHIRFPRDANTSAVSVQYVFDPNALDVYPIGGTLLPDGTTAINTNIVGGVMQVQNLQVTSSPFTAKDEKVVAATLDTYHSSTSGQFDTHLVLNKTIVVRNTGAASADIRIYGSVDGVDYDVLMVPTATLIAGGVLVHYSNNFMWGLRIDSKSTAAGVPTSVIIRVAGIAV